MWRLITEPGREKEQSSTLSRTVCIWLAVFIRLKCGKRTLHTLRGMFFTMTQPVPGWTRSIKAASSSTCALRGRIFARHFLHPLKEPAEGGGLLAAAAMARPTWIAARLEGQAVRCLGFSLSLERAAVQSEPERPGFPGFLAPPSSPLANEMLRPLAPP